MFGLNNQLFDDRHNWKLEYCLYSVILYLYIVHLPANSDMSMYNNNVTYV